MIAFSSHLVQRLLLSVLDAIQEPRIVLPQPLEHLNLLKQALNQELRYLQPAGAQKVIQMDHLTVSSLNPFLHVTFSVTQVTQLSMGHAQTALMGFGAENQRR